MCVCELACVHICLLVPMRERERKKVSASTRAPVCACVCACVCVRACVCARAPASLPSCKHELSQINACFVCENMQYQIK